MYNDWLNPGCKIFAVFSYLPAKDFSINRVQCMNVCAEVTGICQGADFIFKLSSFEGVNLE